MEVVSFLNNCYRVIREVQSIRSALKFHKEKGNELADRLALLEEHLKTIQDDQGGDSHQASTAAKALCKLQGHLVKAYEVLLKCRKGKILRIISYGSIRDEIVDVNLSMSTCPGDFAFFNTLPKSTQKDWEQLLQRLQNMAPLKAEEVESDAIPQEVLAQNSDADDVAARGRALRALRVRGLISAADLAAFSDEVFVQTENDRESVNTLLREMGEEVLAARQGKAAEEENDLQDVCRSIQVLEPKDGSSSGNVGSSSGNDGSFRGDPPPEYLCPITGQLMVDPVVLIETGHTYERAAIERWLSKRATCPRSNQSVRSTLCAPVVQLRFLICEWAERNGVPLERPVYQTNSLTLPLQNLSTVPDSNPTSPQILTAAHQTQVSFDRPNQFAVPAVGGSQPTSNDSPEIDPLAQYNAGMAHYNGNPQNLPGAIACFHVAVRQKPTFPEALYMLGTCHKAQYRNAALNFFRAAAAQRFAPAQYQLGVMLSGNEGLGFLQAAAQAGVPDAQCALGEFYQQKKKYDVAKGYWTQAAELGHVQAQYLLGLFVLVGGKGDEERYQPGVSVASKGERCGACGGDKEAQSVQIRKSVELRSSLVRTMSFGTENPEVLEGSLVRSWLFK